MKAMQKEAKNHKSLRDLLLGIIGILGVNSICRFLTRSRPRVIMFHKVYPNDQEDHYSDFVSLSVFEEMLSYLSKNFSVYSFRDLLAFYKVEGRFPDNSVVITFDDGFKSFQSNVLPLLQKYSVPATVFVCPHLIEANTTVWSELVFDAYEKDALGSMDMGSLKKLLAKHKAMNTLERTESLEKLIGNSISFNPELADDNRKLMTWNDLKIVISSGLVEVGSHSLSHSILSNESDESSWGEVNHSKILIEKILGQKVSTFCYPNGQQGDFSCRDIELLQKAGYEGAVASSFGLASLNENLYQIPRFGGDFSSIELARKYIDGIEFFQRKFLR